MIKQITITTPGQGLHEITGQINDLISLSEMTEGLCTVFIRHTSASLIIQENADPAVRHDLENWLNSFVKENDPLYTHTSEGPDDMPSHIKSTLTATTQTIPFINSRLTMGTWQGLFLWEHRYRSNRRELVVHLQD